MKLVTRHFGEIEIDEELIIDFDEGIPGFDSLRKFYLIYDADGPNGEESPFCWLQSVEDGNVCFVLMNVGDIFPDYNPLVDTDELTGLGEYDPENLMLYNIARFPEDMKDASVNLKAPIVINHLLKKGKQVVCKNEEYSIRHYIFK